MDEEILEQEPQLTEEEILEQQINEAPDAEQFRCYDMNRPGQPMKYIIVRSESVGKQVISVPKYYELTDNDAVIGYQRWDEDKIVQDFGGIFTTGVQILGQRKRGE